jgi:protein dithiol oxidoreductase (disulfide-forming)
MRHALVTALLAFALVACSHASAPPSTIVDTPSAAPAAAVAPAAPARGAAAAPGDVSAAAQTQQEGADTGTGADRSELALERVASLSPAGELPTGRWVAGTHYQVLVPAQPTAVAAGKVEVLEFFWYGCPHCYALDPTIEHWRANKAPYIEFERVPVLWASPHVAHARLFYTLQALGRRDALHSKVFDAIHRQNDPLWVQGDDKATLADELKFAKANGIGESDFLKAYNSSEVQSDLQHAGDLNRRYQITAVPTFVINGKYETGAGMAGGDANLTALIDDLAASERAR